MANVNESIETLTASLQELTSQSYRHASAAQPLTPHSVAASELSISKEVERFVQDTAAYAVKTRDVSVGSY